MQAIQRAATTYAALAPHCDAAVGRPFFGALRRAFDTLVARHGLRFRDALDLGCGTACSPATRPSATRPASWASTTHPRC